MSDSELKAYIWEYLEENSIYELLEIVSYAVRDKEDEYKENQQTD